MSLDNKFAEARSWAARVDSEALAAMLTSNTGSVYYFAALREWQRRERN